MGQKMTAEEVNQRLSLIFLEPVILVGEYVNKRTPMRLHCNACGHEWNAKGHDLFYNGRNRHCPGCGKKNGQWLECAYCGKKIYRTLSELKNRQSDFCYCSRMCGNLHKNALRKNSGEWDNSQNYRTRAFCALEPKCAVCGWSEDERILEVHHVDGNREHNNITNLVILCPTCHRKITLGYYKLDAEHNTLIEL